MLDLHMRRIPANSKREATVDQFVVRVWVGIFQVAGCQHGFLGRVEGDSTKLLPVAHGRLFCNQFIYREFALKPQILAKTLGLKCHHGDSMAMRRAE